MKLINLTGYDVKLLINGKLVLFPAQGNAVLVNHYSTFSIMIQGVEIKQSESEVLDLPDQAPGIYYIVPEPVKSHEHYRTDLFKLGEKEVDFEGVCVGYKNLIS